MRALRFTLLAGAVFALVGCDSIRSAAGVSKSAPDEFAVVTKAPLIIPPDYNLRPPKPGAPPFEPDPADAVRRGEPVQQRSFRRRFHDDGQLQPG